jgi:hypothetical protein
MGMKQTLDIINRMEADGIVGRYAISGAVAAYYYIEPAVTEDLDLLVSFDEASKRPGSGLITLSPIFSYLKAKGYDEHRKEGLLIEGWAVQFLPVASALDAEALARAEDVEIRIDKTEGAVRTRVLRPEHLVAASLRVGRPKDLIRITQFIEERAVDVVSLCDVLQRHGLRGAWEAFCARTGSVDPCDLHRKS